MSKKMWKNIILFLWTIGLMQYKLSSIPIDCAKRVSMCPVGKEKWEEKTDHWQCETNYRYVCLRDSNGYLRETCMADFPVQAHSSNCPILYACKKNQSYLGPDNKFYHCPEEVLGCPPKNHSGYSIHELYKYPKCIQSNLSAENTSPRTTSMFMTTISTGNVSGQENKHIATVIVLSAILLVAFGCVIVYVLYSRKKNHGYSEVENGENKDVLYSRKRNHGYSQVENGENKGAFEDVLYSRKRNHGYSEAENGENKSTFDEDYGDLRRWIHSINESEADRIRILPLKEYDTIEVDKIYVPLSVVDEFDIHTIRTTDKNTISELTPDNMFFISPGKPARFIFMLGDAGYGKTVHCKRIAKSWCNAWKAENAQNDNDVKVINSEHTKTEMLHEWEKSLKDFEFLFYVPMRDVNNEHVNVKDMINDYYRRFDILKEHLEYQDDILNVLKDKRYKCLIILDGLDEWNISECKKKDLLNKGIPNCEDMYSCTFLITKRSWRFMEVDSKCRQGLFDKIVRLHGLGNAGFERLTTNMLCNYFNIERNSKEFMEQCTNVRMKASSLPEFESLTKIPLLAVFFILTWHEKIDTGHSLTTFYLSMIEALMKKSQIQLERNATFESSVSGILKAFPYMSRRIRDIYRLGKLAFEYQDSQSTTFVLKDSQLEDPEVRETVHLFLRIGLLTKHDASGQIHEDNIRLSFLHKTLQEFMYTLYLVYDRKEADIIDFIINMVSDIEKTLELSTVLTFLSGLSPVVGCKVSSRIAALAFTDKDICSYRKDFPNETYYKVFHLFNLQLGCYREVRRGKSIEDFRESEIKFILSDIFLHGSDSDRLTIRESAAILLHHANDIKSLYMKLIPDNNKEGITNVELKTFLHNSESLVALNIDGYYKGNCRLFDDFSRTTPCLQNLGFHNVAFTDNSLTDFLSKDESKRGIKGLGLFYIKSPEDLVVNYQYQFLSVFRFSNDMSGYVQKRKRCSVPENPTSLRKEKRQPLLNGVLKVLPEYHYLSTLHVYYMDSDEDRRLLLQVVPKIKTLENFGYHGSSIYETPDAVYDAEIIKVLLNTEKLQVIFLCQIILEEDIFMKFTTMPQLKRIRLHQFEMKQSEWVIFARSVSNIETLSKVVLCDTNIDEETFKMLEESSRTIIKDDSKKW